LTPFFGLQVASHEEWSDGDGHGRPDGCETVCGMALSQKLRACVHNVSAQQQPGSHSAKRSDCIGPNDNSFHLPAVRGLYLKLTKENLARSRNRVLVFFDLLCWRQWPSLKRALNRELKPASGELLLLLC
jgi:hypothetical protein